MNAQEPQNEKRKFQRAKLHFSLDYNVRFDEPKELECTVEDLSAGGLRINLGNAVTGSALAAGDAIVGAIESDNPALQMNFRGRVMWIREAKDVDGATLQAGISFDPDVLLSELVVALQPPVDEAAP